ncbi:MAG: heparinase [Candidatus Hydrogenedentota bacterium]
MRLLGAIFLAIFWVTGFPALSQETLVDIPPGPNQLPLTPDDGVTVSLNPPPFTWVPPADDTVTYVLEIAASPDGTKGLIRRDNLPVSTYALPEPLKPGPWYWRYGVKREGHPVAYSGIRSFTVPDNATALPYPDVAESIERVPQSRPRMFVNESSLPAIRERAVSGALAARLQSLREICEPVVGASLVAEPPPITGEGAERGRMFAEVIRSTRPDMDRMEDCALLYLCTGDERFGQEARRRLIHFMSWDPDGSTAYPNNDEPAMWMMMRGVRSYDWTYTLFSAEERKMVEEVMHTRAAQFYDHLRNRRQFHTNPYESHAGRTLGFLGEACIAFAHEWPEAREWLDYVLTCYWNCYPAWGKEDGGWHEGPSYWGAYMGFVLHFVTALRNGTGIDLMHKPFLSATPYYLLYTNPPYAKISPFGDGEHGPSTKGRGHLMYWFSSLLDNPYFRWYSDAWEAGPGVTILGVALEKPELQAKPPSGLPPSCLFPGVGLASLHTDLGDAANDIHFLFKSDPYGSISHGHADQNAFTLEAFGEAIAIASGYYPWYGSDHHRLWQWESKSSNTITIDGGLGQVPRDPKSKGTVTAFRSTLHYDALTGDATAAYQGRLTKAMRRVIHLRPGIYVLFDDVVVPAPAIVEWNLHALSEMQLDEPYQTVTIAQGAARCRVRFVHSENLQFGQRAGATPPPENGEPPQFHFTAYTPHKVAVYQPVTVLIPYREGGENSLPVVQPIQSETGRGVALQDPGGTHVVAFRTAPGGNPWGVGTWESDADAFALFVSSDNRIVKHIILGGTHATEILPDGTRRTVSGSS